MKKRRRSVIMVRSVQLWYESFYGECLRAAVYLVCSVLRLYNTQGWKCIKGRAIAVCWRLVMLWSNPDDPQTNLKKEILCLEYFFHFFFLSRLIFIPICKDTELRLCFSSSANWSSSLIDGGIWGVIFSKASVRHCPHLWYVLASRNENFHTSLLPCPPSTSVV